MGLSVVSLLNPSTLVNVRACGAHIGIEVLVQNEL